MRGRQPTPTALKLIKGNPGHRPLNENEPEFPLAELSAQPPASMNDAARAIWHEHVGTLTTSRVLTSADLPIFAAFCNYYAAYLRNTALADESEGVLGVASRYDRRARQSFDCMLRCARELGMSPASRTRLSVHPANPREGIDAIRARLRA